MNKVTNEYIFSLLSTKYPVQNHDTNVKRRHGGKSRSTSYIVPEEEGELGAWMRHATYCSCTQGRREFCGRTSQPPVSLLRPSLRLDLIFLLMKSGIYLFLFVFVVGPPGGIGRVGWARLVWSGSISLDR